MNIHTQCLLNTSAHVFPLKDAPYYETFCQLHLFVTPHTTAPDPQHSATQAIAHPVINANKWQRGTVSGRKLKEIVLTCGYSWIT